MDSKRKYRISERKKDQFKVGQLAESILSEIKIAEQILLSTDSIRVPDLYDHFNPIRVMLPILETASNIEFAGKGDDSLIHLLDKLKVPEPEIVFYMFRHGLMHFIRPYIVYKNGERVNWAIPFTGEHYETLDTKGIYAKKLLGDLKKYVESFRNNPKEIQVQTGIELVERDASK